MKSALQPPFHSVAPAVINRQAILKQLQSAEVFDLIVVGGGATGLGLALDAALRGLKVALLEAHDFAKGTSSRATKLVHGGVRYLAQGHIPLVREALRERALLLQNAPHLAQALPFVLPSYRWLDTPFYGVGLKVYDALAGAAGLGSTAFLTRSQTRALVTNARQSGLKGGVLYWDGQFDDARLAVALARTAIAQGAALLNYCAVTGLQHTDGKVTGVEVQDAETGHSWSIAGQCVVNATGVWVDTLRKMDVGISSVTSSDEIHAMVQPSQGLHLVVDGSFWPTQHALMIPKTHDGRVLFVVPWLGHTLIGTTDTPRQDAPLEPRPLASEIEFILSHARHYLNRAPTRSDVKSAWVGLRPLANTQGTQSQEATKSISREHTIAHSPSGLVTVTGGKWTTYRAMAEDVLTHCTRYRLLPETTVGLTRHFRLVGAQGAMPAVVPTTQAQGLHSYGNEAAAVQGLDGHDRDLGDGLSEAMVRFAARHEMARTVEDVLARRWRTLFLDAAKARRMAPAVAGVLREELGKDPQCDAFEALCDSYLKLPV
jgi:glycerol-3-phosphate dehydrogenase